MKFKSLAKFSALIAVAMIAFSPLQAQAVTLNLKCPAVNTTYVTKSGNSYTTNSSSVAPTVALGDIGDLLNLGCTSYPGTVTSGGAAGITAAQTSTYAPSADSAATNKANTVNLTAPADTTGTNTHDAYDVGLTISNATGGTNTVNGLAIENYTGDAQVNVNGINIGTSDGLGTAQAIVIGSGWDVGVVNDSGMKLNSTNGTLMTAWRFAADTVANGQTSKTTTLTGVTSSSKCVATGNEVPTNAAYIKSAAPGTDQVVITVSADPGASNLDFTVMCAN